MTTPFSTAWFKKHLLVIGAVCALFAAFVFFRVGSVQNSTFKSENGYQVPIPFLQDASSLKGRITFYGRRNGLDVYEVTYNNGETSETLMPDLVYLVHIPNQSDIVNASLDTVFSSVVTGGRNVDYFGYKYSDTSATVERANVNAPRFADRFPAQFFASGKARESDAQHENMIAGFEEDNDVEFLKTDGSVGSVRLDPAGSLYVFIVNEPGGARLSVRQTGECGDNTIDAGEQCDDGDTDNSNSCTNECTSGIPIPFGSECGNGTLEVSEACDEGQNNGVVCTPATGGTCVYCSTECTEVAVHGSASLCGNGSTEENGADEIAGNADDEQCDDGNVNSTDGCAACHVSQGYICTTSSPSQCEALCGNGSTEENGADEIAGNADDEQCDDGQSNGTPCDLPPGVPAGGASCQYCSTSCKIVTITDDPTPAVCGDGAIEGSEACDDDDTDPGDGCSNACAIESEFRCTGSPSVCQSYLDFVKALADTNRNGIVTGNEVFATRLRVVIAVDMVGSPFDIDNDGDFDSIDIDNIFIQLGILDPTPTE